MIDLSYQLRVFICFLLMCSLSACGLATKQDIADLKRDVQDVRAEVRSGARDQERRAEQQTELVVAVKNKVSQKNGLAGMIVRRSPWSWFGLEFLLFGGLSFTAARRLNRKYGYRQDPLTGDEYASISLINRLTGLFLSRRTIEQPKPDPDPPDPPDDKPPLHVVK